MQADILKYMEKACELIPDQGLTEQCKEMVDSYYPVLIGIITGELVSGANQPSGERVGVGGRSHSEQRAVGQKSH